MGRIITPAYRVDVIPAEGRQTPLIWRVKVHGRPTATNLAKLIRQQNESVLPGGINAHIGERGRIVYANLVRNLTGDSVATWGAL